MTKESAADIIKYLDIVDGNLPSEKLVEGDSVHLGILTEGADIGHSYTYDNGLRWAKITEEQGDHWLIECGLLEYETDNVEYMSKHDMASLIRKNVMILQEDQDNDILTESLSTKDNDNDFNKFIDRVDRYLLVNYMKESTDLNYPWKIAWAEDRIPSEAAEEAILLED